MYIFMIYGAVESTDNTYKLLNSVNSPFFIFVSKIISKLLLSVRLSLLINTNHI